MPKQGTTTARGYGSTHQRKRKRWEPQVRTGSVKCWRCQQPITPNQQWDLGHHDTDRTITLGPEHALAKDCPAGGNRANTRRTHTRRRPRTPTPAATALAWFTTQPDTPHTIGA